MDAIQQYAVRSNRYLSNFGDALPKLLIDEKFVDVTLSCEGRKFKCHRLVLAASSPLFESLFSDNVCPHPIVIMPADIKSWEMQALIDFMYKGSVNLSCEGLKGFCKSAEALQIRGLYDAPLMDLPRDSPRATRLDNDNEAVCNGDVDLDGFPPDRSESPSSVMTHNFHPSGDDNEQLAEEQDGGGAKDDTPKPKDSPTPTLFVNNNDRYRKDNNGNPLTNSAFGIGPLERRRSESEAPAVGKIRVTPNEYLFSPRKTVALKTTPPTTTILPPSLKFNENSMAISVKSVSVDDNEPQIAVSTSVESSSSPPSEIHHVDVDDDADADCENIVCSPSVSYICLNEEEEETTTDDYPGTESSFLDYDKMFTETYGGGVGDDETPPATMEYSMPALVPLSVMNKRQQMAAAIRNYSELKICDARSTAHINLKRALCASGGGGHRSTSTADEPGTSESSCNGMIMQPNLMKIHSVTGSASASTSAGATSPQKRAKSEQSDETNLTELTPNEVILRNPRSNQPRTYGTAALYNALMAVKNGKSIYRASREHQVPRKTLRNWMKRWHIKSQYPMPRQLKEAATKKKITSSTTATVPVPKVEFDLEMMY